MAFQLPRWEELTNTQRNVLNTPYSFNVVVRGAPGTGKSVLAVYRAADYANRDQRVLFLVYNKPLENYIRSAVDSLKLSGEVRVKRFHTWLREFYILYFRAEPPELARYSEDAYPKYDYKKITEDFKKLDVIFDCIILDEAQDFPLEFIRALTYIGKTVNCFIDDNQRILCEQRTRYADIYNLFEEEPAFYTLQDNFRNTEEIYRFADIYSAHKEKISTKKKGEKPLFAAISNDEERFTILKTLILNNSTSTIGIITSAHEQESYLKKLTALLDGKVPIKAYDGGSENYKLWNIDFKTSGVYVLSTGTTKGLEFDIVIIPKVDRLRAARDRELDANIFYVAATRASDELYCLYSEKRNYYRCIDVFGPLGQHEDLVRWE